MFRVRTISGLASCVLVLAACSASTGGSASAAPASPAPASAAPSAPASSAPSARPSTAASPTGAASNAATAGPSAINPCTLVTAKEASTLTGLTFPASRESTLAGFKICTYGQEGNSFVVEAAIAPDAATAKKAEQQAMAQAQKDLPVAFKTTRLTAFAPGVDAVMAQFTGSLQGTTVSAIGIYVLKGAAFFDITDVAMGGTTPTAAALQAQAKISLARVP